MPMKVMLDSMIYDEIVAKEGFSRLLEDAVKCGHVVILKTHIQDDQLADIPNECRREAVAKVPGHKIPTSAAIWGVSKWNEACWGDSAGDIKISHIQKGKPKHSADALIAVTAALHADVLVTHDVQLRKRVEVTGSNLKVWDFKEFCGFIESLPQAT